MPTYCEIINQIQIGGLQPCDDLTWNDSINFLRILCNQFARTAEEVGQAISELSRELSTNQIAPFSHRVLK